MRKLILIISFLLSGLAFANPPGTFQPLLLSTNHPVITVTAGSPAQVNNGDSACTTCTYTGLGIGAVTSDRVIIVGVSGVSLAVRTISSVTIGGVAMSQIAVASDAVCGSGCVVSAIYALACNSSCINATTATAVVVWSTAIIRGAVGGWAITGNSGISSSFATATNGTNSQTMNVSLTAPINGAMIALAGDSSGNSNSCTWTASPATATKDYDVNPGTNDFSGAHANSLTGVTVTPQCAFTATTVGAAIAAASFGQ